MKTHRAGSHRRRVSSPLSWRHRLTFLRRLRFEPLEDRRLLSVIPWDGGPSGTGTSWQDPVNWVGDELPGPTDDAEIGPAFASNTVTSAANVTIHNLTSYAALQITAGTFTAEAVTLNGTLTIATGASLTANEGLALNGDSTILNGASLTVKQGLALNATLMLNSTGSATSVYFVGTQTVTTSP